MAQKRGFFLVTLYALLFAAGVVFPVESAQARTARHKQHHKRHAQLVYLRPQPASYIVDVDTGAVMESENADSLRYPASLTKMMTLYLTFEALKKDKLSLDEMLPVSAHAASQPQTNLALQPGDHIAVKDAILSIVVRSANDSAVTLGEALGGGSEIAFAEKMTAKAHALGMSHTLFYNASGLPNPAQHTSARDMATLGLALKKNFPQYFPFFKTESFSYRGLTYVTHNHVMMRYEGVDGIKTGFIRASGFNLVTSATRDNHHIVAVVLGGSTIRSRDDKMIALLDKSFNDLAELPGNRVRLASTGRRIPAFPSKIEKMEENMEGEGDRPGDDVIATSALHHSKSSSGESSPDDKPPILAAREQSEPAQEENADMGEHGLWGIQVGAFARVRDAQAAADRAVHEANEALSGSKIFVSDDNAGAVHRARLTNITQEQAENACHVLEAAHRPCFVYKVN